MSIEAMKQALQALEFFCEYGAIDRPFERIAELKQAIAEAEKQEPAFYVIPATDRFGEGYEQTFWEDPAGFPVYTRPVYASDISQERVDETAKHEFECPRCGHCCRDGLERLCRIMGTFDLATGHADTIDEALDALESELRDVLGHLRARREWVGLTHEERDEIDQNCRSHMEALFAIEAKLKEKNG